jgi:hypothetical protein
MSLGYPAVSRVTSSVAAEAANAITVSLQLYGPAQDREATESLVFFCYLSSDAAGDTAVAAQTSMAAGTDGSVVGIVEAAKSLICKSEADGDFDMVVTDTGTASRYLQVCGELGGPILHTATLPFA